MEPLLVLTVLLVITSKTSAQFECIGTCYSGRMLPDAKDTFHGKHLKGFSYKNITTDDPRKCYSSCTQDCRCKACQMKDARCELLEEDKNSKADNFTVEPGYVYYDLVQTMYKGKSHMVPPGVCLNGCCQSQPCMNGGTCIEHCDTPKKKFSCKCVAKFKGNVCDQKTFYSCLDVLRASSTTPPANGLYTITRQDNGQQKLFYCAFNLRGTQAWTLIESFSRSTKSFQYVSFGQSHNGVYSNPLNWQAYRLSHRDLMYARSKATMFRSTCNFPQRMTTFKNRDFLLGYLQQYDITTTNPIAGQCATFEMVNIRGSSFSKKRFPVWQMSGTWHFHIDSYYTESRCDFLKVPTPVSSEDNFGYYGTYNTAFLCTATADSTTNWWLGQQA